MNLSEILKVLQPIGVAGVVILIGNLIKVTPLQINVWSWLARKIGNALNHDLLTQIKQIQDKQVEVEGKLDSHIKENEVDQILRVRKTILNFGREMLQGIRHTREEFIEILDYIDAYENYCKLNPDFQNSRAVLAIKLIKDNYQERLEKADFLAEEYRVKKEDQ